MYGQPVKFTHLFLLTYCHKNFSTKFEYAGMPPENWDCVLKVVDDMKREGSFTRALPDCGDSIDKK
jgi:hypothetical protein